MFAGRTFFVRRSRSSDRAGTARRRWVTAAKVGIGLRGAVGLVGLTIRLRRQSVPTLFQEIEGHRGVRGDGGFDYDTLARIVKRTGGQRFWFDGLFPRRCLREALMTYRTCTEAGIAVRLFIGVRKDGGRLLAHSWVQRLDETPATGQGSWRILYSHPALPEGGPAHP